MKDLKPIEHDIIAALNHAFQLGQTYWSQADSESYSQNKKSAETLKRFQQLTDVWRANMADVVISDKNQPQINILADICSLGDYGG